MRLDKFLSEAGVASRKELKTIIRSGRVTLDGVAVKSPETKVDETCQQVCLDGQPVSLPGQVVGMLHKPAGYVTSTEDPREETVLSLLPNQLRRLGLFPVGRLDKDTEGLLLLTNDGPLAHQLLAPNRHVDKVYYTEVDGQLDEADREAFREGLTLADGTVCRPAALEILADPSQALVTLREGKYHQVKRMLAARGKPVVYLKRLSMGPLTLDPSLPTGRWRMLSQEERAALGR